MELPSEESAKLIASRSVCVRRIVHLWASTFKISDLHLQLKAKEEYIKPFFSPTKTFKIKVDTFCNHQTQGEKLKKIEVTNVSHFTKINIGNLFQFGVVKYTIKIMLVFIDGFFAFIKSFVSLIRGHGPT